MWPLRRRLRIWGGGVDDHMAPRTTMATTQTPRSLRINVEPPTQCPHQPHTDKDAEQILNELKFGDNIAEFGCFWGESEEKNENTRPPGKTIFVYCQGPHERLPTQFPSTPLPPFKNKSTNYIWGPGLFVIIYRCCFIRRKSIHDAAFMTLVRPLDASGRWILLVGRAS